MKKKPRNRAAQNTTLINLRALKARVRDLEFQVALLMRGIRPAKLREGDWLKWKG